MSEELKPCPFCGGKALLHERSQAPEAWVYCRCGGAGPMSETDDGAKAKWNQREAP